MHYLVTAAPYLLAHGTYSYHEVTKEKAFHWLEQHHKELKVATIAAIPNQQPQFAANPQYVQLLAKHLDRFIAPEQIVLPALNHEDEVLVVHHRPTPAVRPGTPQPVTVETLTFAMFKCHADHQATA